MKALPSKATGVKVSACEPLPLQDGYSHGHFFLISADDFNTSLQSRDSDPTSQPLLSPRPWRRGPRARFCRSPGLRSYRRVAACPGHGRSWAPSRCAEAQMLSGELAELSKQPATELLVRKARLTPLQAQVAPHSAWARSPTSAKHA